MAPPQNIKNFFDWKAGKKIFEPKTQRGGGPPVDFNR